MLNKAVKFYAVTAAFAFGAVMASPTSMAALISASVGGVPVGASVYENFDNLAAAGGLSASGITVSFRAALAPAPPRFRMLRDSMLRRSFRAAMAPRLATPRLMARM